MDVKNTHSVTKTEISVFGRHALDAERRRSPSLADKVLKPLIIRLTVLARAQAVQQCVRDEHTESLYRRSFVSPSQSGVADEITIANEL